MAISASSALLVLICLTLYGLLMPALALGLRAEGKRRALLGPVALSLLVLPVAANRLPLSWSLCRPSHQECPLSPKIRLPALGGAQSH